jgi:hypothetical protein
MKYRRVEEEVAPVHMEGYIAAPLQTYIGDDGSQFHLIMDIRGGESLCFAAHGFPCRPMPWIPTDLFAAVMDEAVKAFQKGGAA